MTQAVPIPESDADDVTYQITLGGVQIAYRLRWWQRLSGWYMRVTTPNGTLVSDWHRAGPEAEATWDVTAPGHPPGRLVWAGVGNADDRQALWRDLELQYVPDAT